MRETIPTIRIFISSPGDVAVEREKARKVVETLQKRYAGRLKLETMLWEDLPLGAETSFQQGIDLVLSDQHGVDIAVFILWSRLGSPLGAAIRKPDGTEYRSGTEREFDMMLSARALLDAVPELRVDDETLAELGEVLAGGLDKALKMLLKRVFPDAGKAGAMRLVLLLDQFEELFTASGASDEEIRCFLRAIQSLACSGFVWVLATVRSDFYDRCQRFPILMEMKGSQGQIDLLPPEPSDIHRIITGPAMLAGVAFEKSNSGESLDQRILNDVVGHPEALPLLEFTLAQLYNNRTPEGVLTFAAYVKFGGVEGAIGRHAETVFTRLSPDAQKALPLLLTMLCQVDLSTSGRYVRRRCATEEYNSIRGAEEVACALVDERLLVLSDDPNGKPIAYVSHESLFEKWTRAKQILHKATDEIEARSYLLTEMERWMKSGKKRDFLLPEERIKIVYQICKRSEVPFSRSFLDYVEASEQVAHYKPLYIGSFVCLQLSIILCNFIVLAVAAAAEWSNSRLFIALVLVNILAQIMFTKPTLHIIQNRMHVARPVRFLQNAIWDGLGMLFLAFGCIWICLNSQEFGTDDLLIFAFLLFSSIIWFGIGINRFLRVPRLIRTHIMHDGRHCRFMAPFVVLGATVLGLSLAISLFFSIIALPLMNCGIMQKIGPLFGSDTTIISK